MLIKTRGIVLRSFKYAESSIIAEIYTEQKGLKKYIVSGVRGKKSKVAPSLLQVMSIVDLVAYDKEGKDLNRIKEIRAAYIFQSLPFKVAKGAIGLFVTEVAQKVLKQSEQNEPLFDFLYSFYTFLDQTQTPIANLHLWFLTHLTNYLGFYPGGEHSSATPFFDLKEGVFVRIPPLRYALEERNGFLLEQLLSCKLETAATISLNRKGRNEMLEHLLHYYQLHLDNFSSVNAHKILKEVFG